MASPVQAFKEFHLLDLIEVSAAVNDRDLIYLRFRTSKAAPATSTENTPDGSSAPTTLGTVLVTIHDARTGLLIKNVRESVRKMTNGVHPFFDVKIVIPPDQYAVTFAFFRVIQLPTLHPHILTTCTLLFRTALHGLRCPMCLISAQYPPLAHNFGSSAYFIGLCS